MITIPTCELVGIVSDVVAFASPDKDYPAINSVHIYWDGDHLHAEATDRYAVGHAHWRPGDDPEIDAQEELGVEWGGADDPWSVVVSLAEAKEIISVFKLPPKQGWTALYVELIDGIRLKISRRQDDAHTALTQVIHDSGFEYPDSAKYISQPLFNVPTAELWFNAKLLASFAKVRQRGTLNMQFGGDSKIVKVTIGARFEGAIMPVRPEKKTEPETTSSVRNDMDALV